MHSKVIVFILGGDIYLAERIVQFHCLKERSKLLKVDLLCHLGVLNASIVGRFCKVECRQHSRLAVKVIFGLAHLHRWEIFPGATLYNMYRLLNESDSVVYRWKPSLATCIFKKKKKSSLF